MCNLPWLNLETGSLALSVGLAIPIRMQSKKRLCFRKPGEVMVSPNILFESQTKVSFVSQRQLRPVSQVISVLRLQVCPDYQSLVPIKHVSSVSQHGPSLKWFCLLILNASSRIGPTVILNDTTGMARECMNCLRIQKPSATSSAFDCLRG